MKTIYQITLLTQLLWERDFNFMILCHFITSILDASDLSTSASLVKEIFDSEEVYHKRVEAEAKVRHLLKVH